MGGKLNFWNLVETKYRIESACSIKCKFLKLGIYFALAFSLLPPENRFRDGIDSHKEAILWNRCLGSLTQFKIRPLFYSSIIRDRIYLLGELNVLYLKDEHLMMYIL
jgi:hypothetical protein